MADVRRTEGAPHDRLTRMCDAAITAFEAHPEHCDGDKCIVFLDDGKRGGIVLNGYDNDVDAMTDLLMHLRAIFRANGKDLQIHALRGEGG
jgi:hypothetical protein